MATRAATKVPSRRRGASPRVQVSEMQRARLLSAAVVTVEDLGWSGASVAHITARARVSRRTFYDLFENREDCLLAVLDEVVERVERELVEARLSELSWRERVRAGLWTILCFLDREPVLARVCVAQALQRGPRVLARREEILARLAGALDEGRNGENGRSCPPLTAEGLIGAVFSIVYARSTRSERKPLANLFGELMGMLVLPYSGPAIARREQDRVVPLLPAALASTPGADSARIEQDPLREVPMRLTYRTARVLETIAERPRRQQSRGRRARRSSRPGPDLKAARAPGAPRARRQHRRRAQQGRVQRLEPHHARRARHRASRRRRSPERGMTPGVLTGPDCGLLPFAARGKGEVAVQDDRGAGRVDERDRPQGPAQDEDTRRDAADQHRESEVVAIEVVHDASLAMKTKNIKRPPAIPKQKPTPRPRLIRSARTWAGVVSSANRAAGSPAQNAVKPPRSVAQASRPLTTVVPNEGSVSQRTRMTAMAGTPITVRGVWDETLAGALERLCSLGVRTKNWRKHVLVPVSGITPRPLGALSHNNNRGALLVPSHFHMEER